MCVTQQEKKKKKNRISVGIWIYREERVPRTLLGEFRRTTWAWYGNRVQGKGM